MTDQEVADLQLYVAARLKLEKDCDCWYIVERNEGRSETIRKMPDANCPKCGGRGTITTYPLRVEHKDCQVLNHNTPSYGCDQMFKAFYGDCQGRGWVANTDTIELMRVTRLTTLEYDNKNRWWVTFNREPSLVINVEDFIYALWWSADKWLKRGEWYRSQKMLQEMGW